MSDKKPPSVPPPDDGFELPNDFWDSIFEHLKDADGRDPSDWNVLRIRLVPEDQSADPTGEALEPTKTDANAAAKDASRQVFDDPTDGSSDHEIDPNAIPLEAEQIKGIVDRDLPNIDAELRDDNRRLREKREQVLADARDLKKSLIEAKAALVEEARAKARHVSQEFYRWCYQSIIRIPEIYCHIEEWAAKHPIAFLVVAAGVAKLLGSSS